MTLPTVGGGEGAWGTTLNAHINVGHDSDGTHTKSQMLTDMGWSPTSYIGGESVTFPNGLIIKQGTVARTGATTTVTFATAFPAAGVNGWACGGKAQDSFEVQVTAVSTTTMSIFTFNANSTPMRWFAIGY